MKIRTDFVSNSSSSSFIVSLDDNKYLTLLQNPKYLTFKEYFDRYIDDEITLSYYSWNLPHIKYVDDAKFVDMFLDSINKTMPKSLKQDVIDYLAIVKGINDFTTTGEYKYDNPIIEVATDESYELYDLIKSKIFDILKPKYGNMILCYEEVEDNSIDYNAYYKEDADIKDGIMSKDDVPEDAVNDEQSLRKLKYFLQKDEIMTYEDLYRKRIEYMNSIHPLKFYRIFSNH